MRVAIVGGNLTGCATAWFLEKSYADLRKEYELRARCQEDDSDVLPPPPENFKVTIFEKSSVLGGNKLQTEIIEDVAVEAGRNSTLHSDGVYVGEVLDQMSSELELDRFWLEGTGYHSVRSFAIYDADNSEYLFRHGGYWGLDILKVVASSIFTRFLLLVGCGFALYHGRFEMSGLARLKTIAAAVFVFISLVLFPRRFLASVNRSLAFWSSAIVGLMTYGTTAALSRGASKGFTDHFKAMLKANATTKSITLGHLFNRCGLGSYSSTDAESAFRSFKFLPAFVRHYSDTQLQVDYANSQLAAKDVSTLAAMLCQQRADVSEGDKVLRIRGGNAKLCEALGRGSRQMLNAAAVKIKKRSAEEIESGKQAYILSYKIPAQAEPVEEEFNGIVLACSPNMEELTFETPGMDNSGDVFGYTKEILTTQTPRNRSRWLALVAGTLNHRCLGHLIADTVPDMILSTSGKDWLKVHCALASLGAPTLIYSLPT
uniref:Uncharacterized protein n=1 Tax=Rhodosorus marinus TaxID=101924 RepID=A0A7S3E6K1_9RHOD|mmetsp:Transcript_13144/g.52242  ORF Transcript_13144/g.52242 Transcript_13144/m.52242 type:complete len:487 (+) Transcript_13144:145-1605(+)